MRGTLIAKHAPRIRRIARRHGVVRLRVFGSRVSGKATQSSDLDLLVDLKPERDLLDLVEFKLEVERLLGREVDVVTAGALSPYLRARILREARPL
jgi:predicted nucleotidyltransferase